MNILRIVYDFADEFVAAEGLSTGPYELTLAQAKQGHKIYVLTGNLNGKNIKRLRFKYDLAGGKVTVYNLPRALKYFGVFLTSSVFVLPYYFYFRLFNKIDVVHVHQQMGIYFFVYKYLFGWLDRIKVVYTNHGPIVPRYKKLVANNAPLSFWFKNFEYPLWSFNDWLAVRVANKIVAVSESVKKELIDEYFDDNDFVNKPIYILENGVNLDKFNVSNKKINFGFTDGDVIIGNIGRLSQRKNIHLIVESLAYLPAQFKLVLIGEWDSDYKLNMIDPILQKSDHQGNKIANRVKYLGIKKYWEIQDYFRSIDIFVLPSMHEGLPKVVLEAIASGCKVLASGFTLDHNLADLYFIKKLTPEAIAEQITDVAKSPAKFDVSKKTLDEYYSWDLKALELDDIMSHKGYPFMTFGTAVSAHQTEGNNTNSDWWKWEQSKDYKSGLDKITGEVRKWPLEPSELACDSYNRYTEDFDLAKELGTDAIRISLEWARIEPKQGVYDETEINHYKVVLKSAKDRGLKTFVTLHHFTNPIWLSDIGGWANKLAPKYFGLYAHKCALEFGELTDVFLTINEPQVYAGQAYINGEWPPARRNDFFNFIKVQWHFIVAHKLAFQKIKSVNFNYKVGFVNNLIWHHSNQPWYLFWDHIYSRILNFLNADSYMLFLYNYLDLIGVNYYFSGTFKNFKSKNKNDWVSDMNWWIFPVGLYYILKSISKYNLPIYITENGLADANDATRSRFLNEMIDICKLALEKKIPLSGYFYWSLIDNYEWHQGYWPKFGLVNIDRNNNLKRIKRPSFEEYKKLIKEFKKDMRSVESL